MGSSTGLVVLAVVTLAVLCEGFVVSQMLSW